MLSVPRNIPTGLPLLLILLALIAAVFWPALGGGFIFDDYPIFAENSAIQVHGWDWQAWQNAWQWSHEGIQRPLAMMTYTLNYAIGGGVFGFKVTNLIIHLINTLLLMNFCRRLLQEAWLGLDARRATWWSVGVTAAWAVHPLQVSTVMYVVQRMEMLGFTCVMLSLLVYWRGRRLQMTHHRGWPWILLSLAFVVLGCNFKETAALAPGYALLLECTVLHFGAGDAVAARRWRLAYTVGSACTLLFATFYLIPHYANPGYYVGRDFTAWQRELTQLRVLPLYLGWSLAPLPGHLVFYYDDYIASTGLLHPVTTLLGGMLLLALIVVALLVRKRRPLVALGIGWFFVAHVLTSAPVPLELVFEHRNYPALFGVVLVLADIAYWLTQRTKSNAILIVACILVANLGFLTILRASTWGSPFRLATELADANPQSLRAAMDLARRLMAMSGGNMDSPLYSLSVKELERAARLPSASPLPEETLLLEASRNPDIQAQPWWDSIKRKLEVRPLIPDTYFALHKLTSIRLANNTGIDAQQLGDSLALALRRNPDRQMMHVDYAELAGGVMHDPALAILHWQEALRLNADGPSYGVRLAQDLVDARRYDEAAAVINKLIELNPTLQGNRQLKTLLDKARPGPSATGSEDKGPTSDP